ncbi:MAG: MFS transporter, partial [Anaerolineales bacterium]|nr:MFS transporter [Anaerolineales bacterium]
MSPKWRTVLTLALAEFLGMALWFSASAVTPALRAAWQLNDGQTAWLTMSVQIGFVVGALTSAFLNLADIYPPRYVFAGGALLGALANGLIPLLADSLGPALLLRFITGIAQAAVYPVGMKILATWMKEDRGLGLGLLIGALTLGSASPHLIRALGGISSWHAVLYVASLLSVFSALLGYLSGHLGPFQAQTPPFNWRIAWMPYAIGACAWQTLATWATCGSCTRSGPGSRCFYWSRFSRAVRPILKGGRPLSPFLSSARAA